MKKILVLFLMFICMPVHGETIYWDDGTITVNCKLIKNNDGEVIKIFNKNEGLLWQHPAYSIDNLLNKERYEINKAYTDCLKISPNNAKICMSTTIEPIQDKYYSDIRELKLSLKGQNNIIKIEKDKRLRSFFSTLGEFLTQIAYQISK